MKAILKHLINGEVTYDALMFVCPGCETNGSSGLHLLPVTNTQGKSPQWDWNGNLDTPTLDPSILTTGNLRCHSYLREGVFEFLSDSTHSLAGQSCPMPDLPEWVTSPDSDLQ